LCVDFSLYLQRAGGGRGVFQEYSSQNQLRRGGLLTMNKWLASVRGGKQWGEDLWGE
jgi:hypothetical protein